MRHEDFAVFPLLTDEDRDVAKKIANRNSGKYLGPCAVCGEKFLQNDSPYWNIHEWCIEKFRANKLLHEMTFGVER